MAGHKMADLMAKHRRKLIFIFEISQKPSGHKDIAPIHGEGINRGVVEDSESVALGILLGGAKHPVAHALHVLNEGPRINGALFLKFGERLFPIGARLSVEGAHQHCKNEKNEGKAGSHNGLSAVETTQASLKALNRD
jgi:hypothetical protein